MEEKSSDSPFDINGHNFNPDMYFNKLLKESNLKQVMDKESEIVKDAQSLHSDMQTLVYENYNKFISATETIRKMKVDFRMMENEMESLTSNMKAITAFSEQISSTLQGTRTQVAELSNKHDVLKRLQFLFKLPKKLKLQMQESNYVQAVQDYKHAKSVLEQYGNLESFKGIRSDCENTVDELRSKLHEKLKSYDTSVNELSSCIQLLIELDEPVNSLSTEFLDYGRIRLKNHLSTLSDYSSCQDMIEFVDLGSNGFLSDLCITVATYNDLFNKDFSLDEFKSVSNNGIVPFITQNMELYFNVVKCRIENEQDVDDSAILVRGLDKFCKKLQATNVLMNNIDFSKSSIEIVIKAARKQCRSHLNILKSHFADTVTNIRQAIATSKPMHINQIGTKELRNNNGPGSSTSGSNGSQSYETVFSEFLTSLVTNTIEKVKGILQDLMVFLQPELIFSNKKSFLESFCVDSVREGLVVSFIHYMITTISSYTEYTTPLPLLFVLSKTCLLYHSSAIHQLLNLVDKWFHIEEFPKKNLQLSTETELCADMYSVAHTLINHYVRMQGMSISQMLRKSVETRDWLHGLEPRTVRAVMKRIIEELTTIDIQIGVLFEEGSKGTADRSSDSSRKTQSRHHRSVSNWSSYTSGSSHSLSVINKIFSERIDIFAPVQFSKVSIMTGIIKISLKTLLECVRLKTFSKYGLQQVQVDTHYLQLYLWRFLHDENLINSLLDDILGSAVHRCLDPVLMEPSVIEIICERG